MNGKKYEYEYVLPAEIEKRSFEIIGEELREMGKELPADKEDIIKRVIHTSADFEYADTLVFTNNAVEEGLKALAEGCTVVTDTNMAKSGISAPSIKMLGGEVLCFMAEEETISLARAQGTTRAAVSMERAAALNKDLIIAVGNAPTALVRLSELIREGKIKPRLIIAVPVGFVNVVPAKEEILSLPVPVIAARGRKGGSNVAAAIVNALIYRLTRKA